jgi:hypothetical protein
LGFWWHKCIDLGLNKRRAWFKNILFRCPSEFTEPFLSVNVCLHWLNNVDCLFFHTHLLQWSII